MKKLLSIIGLLLATLSLQAQILDPVSFKTEFNKVSDDVAEIVFTAKIDPGWHIYSTDLGDGGPISASFNIDKITGAHVDGKLLPVGNEQAVYDKLFGMDVRYFEKEAKFVQRIRLEGGTYRIEGYLEYAACNDQNCLPPSEESLMFTGTADIAAAEGEATEDEAEDEEKEESSAENEETTESSVADSQSPTIGDQSSWWQPVISELRAFGESAGTVDRSWLYIFFTGFIGGLLALFTPCVWPIIPMTVSFFLKRAKDDRQKGIRDAVTYGISIVVIYLVLGIGVTAIFGPSTLNALSTNAIFNIILFLLLVVFAVSFFGWFEIKLPDSWANSVDTKASKTTGFVSIFLMAFTLVLVSFSCTAPIIGLLLVQTVTSGDWLAPAIGMFGFALALAVPFTIFAMFPTLMKKSPKSGSWMDQIKVVLGFVELAFSLKFLSVADLAYGWHLLDREVFLSLWIVIFFALGAYLVGWLKFQQDAIGGDLNKPMAVPAIMLGLCSMAFAVYMIPGLWGAPCKAVSAFAPPINTQDFNLNSKTVEAKYTDYEAGMAAAKAQGKPVLLDFTGFGCVNCRKMEASVWTDPQVADKLTKDYILISLFVDDKTPLAEPIKVNEDGQQRTLRTIGDKWSYLQSHKFGANAQPFYVAVDNEGKPLTASHSYKEDVQEYIEFLDKGLENYNLSPRSPLQGESLTSVQ